MRSLLESGSGYPPVLLVHPAGLEEGADFFAKFWPEARAVSDPDGRLYEALGLDRASLRQLFGPGIWVKALKAMRQGHSARLPIGNPWLMPAALLVLNARILWRWEFKNIGDHPDFAEIRNLVPAPRKE